MVEIVIRIVNDFRPNLPLASTPPPQFQVIIYLIRGNHRAKCICGVERDNEQVFNFRQRRICALDRHCYRRHIDLVVVPHDDNNKSPFYRQEAEPPEASLIE